MKTRQITSLLEILVCIMLVLSFTSCESPVDSDEKEMDADLVGTWTGTDEWDDTYTVVIADNGTITITDSDNDPYGKYEGTASGGSGDYVSVEDHFYVLDGNTLTLDFFISLTRDGSGTGLVGTWSGIAFTVPISYTFNADNTYSLASSGVTISGTYTNTDTIITMKQAVDCTYSLVDNTLTLTIDDETYTLTK